MLLWEVQWEAYKNEEKRQSRQRRGKLNSGSWVGHGKTQPGSCWLGTALAGYTQQLNLGMFGWRRKSIFAVYLWSPVFGSGKSHWAWFAPLPGCATRSLWTAMARAAWHSIVPCFLGLWKWLEEGGAPWVWAGRTQVTEMLPLWQWEVWQVPWGPARNWALPWGRQGSERHTEKWYQQRRGAICRFSTCTFPWWPIKTLGFEKKGILWRPLHTKHQVPASPGGRTGMQCCKDGKRKWSSVGRKTPPFLWGQKKSKRSNGDAWLSRATPSSTSPGLDYQARRTSRHPGLTQEQASEGLGRYKVCTSLCAPRSTAPPHEHPGTLRGRAEEGGELGPETYT